MSNASPLNRPARIIAYINGFNLYFGLKHSGWRKYMWLDIRRLVEQLATNSQTVVGVRYFTSRVNVPADKARRQDQYLQALGNLSPAISLHYGKYLPSTYTCRNCNHARIVQHEKMTDVNVAVSLVEDASSDRFDTAFLVSGDSDLCPPIELVKRLFPAKRIIVAFPPGRHSNELKKIAHGSFVIGEAKLRTSQLPNTIILPNGFRLTKPQTWV